MRPKIGVLLSAAVFLGACVADQGYEPPVKQGFVFPPAPAVHDGPIDPGLGSYLRRLTPTLLMGTFDAQTLEPLASSDDARLAWFLSDLLRFAEPDEQGVIVDAFERLTGVDLRADPSFGGGPWTSMTDHLIAWDLPAWDGYAGLKAPLFLLLEPGWAPFFADADAEIDWRLVSWGGVFIDARPLGDLDPCPRGCIPALDDPALTVAEDGSWYPDDAIVFGIVVGGEAVALPKNIMEVHEMVNMTIGGRRLGIPYCTLCGSAQAYLTDSVPAGVAQPVLRTSGLLSRSNKVMYDLNTFSIFDTFTGRALSGPLQDRNVVLEQVSVVTSTWAAWKQAHPDTKIVAEDGGIGRTYEADPLRGRDDEGPIFPIGDVDSRLAVQTQVLGVIAPDGTPVAFPVEAAVAALAAGERVELNDIALETDGDGLRARAIDGRELPAHQAFWFAWSQFHPDTEVWER